MRKISKNLDLLTQFRGIAAWWVVLYHIRDQINIPVLHDVVAIGYLAVDFFFVLSGFIISYAYYEKLSHFSKTNIIKFYLKRLGRTYPLHLFVLCTYCLLPLLYIIFDKNLPSGGKYNLEYLALSFSLIQNWGFTKSLAWNVPAWSISTEFFAYLIFPLIVAWLFKIPNKTGTMIVLLFALCSIPVIFTLYGTTDIGKSITRLGLIRCVIEFLIGVCCYRLFSMNTNINHTIAIFLFCSGSLLLLLQPLLINLNATLYCIPLSSALIIYSTLYLPERFIQFISSNKLLYLGSISYSTYMLHYLILDIFKLGTPHQSNINVLWVGFYLLCLFAASVTTFKYIENTSRNWLNKKIDIAFR